MDKSNFPGYKQCTACRKPIKSSDERSHLLQCRIESRSLKLVKLCPWCQKKISSEEFETHLDICDQNIDEIYETPPENSFSTRLTSETSEGEKNSFHCPFCSQWFENDLYEKHLFQCSSSSTSTKLSLFDDSSSIQCFSCETSSSKDSLILIRCPSNHSYCYSCLIHSLKEIFNRNDLIVCHQSKCFYELSTEDFDSLPLPLPLPLPNDIFLRLRRSIRRIHRPFCSICQFYFDETFHQQTFAEHQQICSSENRSMDQNEFEENFLDLILPRVKYPLDRRRIRFIWKKYFINKKINRTMRDFVIEFSSSTFTCQICHNEKYFEDFLLLHCPNEDFLCFQCFYHYLSLKQLRTSFYSCPICSMNLSDEDFNEIYFQRFRSLEKENLCKEFISCPNGFCQWKKEIDRSLPRSLIRCFQCSTEFCSKCSSKYHYRTQCEQIPLMIQNWIRWIEQNSSLTSKINENSYFPRLYDELIQNEIYKSQYCRHCPSCEQLIEYRDGCQTIVCGENAHRSQTNQIGCRTIFQWSKAKFYQPKIQNHTKENVQVDFQQFKCDQCHRQIDGIRFQCLFCPSISFCFDCHDQSISNHWKEYSFQHLFALIRLDENE